MILKVLLGLMFIVSAILKVFDMDKFEIYIYSFHFFSLNFSFLVARAVIIAELVLGIGLVSNCFHKLIWWGSMAMLGGYLLLLIYAQIIGRTDSCHCFGELLPFNPWQSILKNIVLIGLLALIYKVKGFQFKGQRIALVGIAIAITVSIFIISPPDNYTSNYNDENNLHKDLFAEMLSEPLLDSLHLKEGKQVVCLFSTTCKYCQMAAQKLSLMQQYYNFPPENITYIFIGDEESIATFYEQSESAGYRNVLYPDIVNIIKVVNGNFPTLVFMENGAVVHEYGMRNMMESEIKAFFTKS